jgi:hypothetical protein
MRSKDLRRDMLKKKILRHTLISVTTTFDGFFERKKDNY